jgi:hypothetical protein
MAERGQCWGSDWMYHLCHGLCLFTCNGEQAPSESLRGGWNQLGTGVTWPSYHKIQCAPGSLVDQVGGTSQNGPCGMVRGWLEKRRCHLHCTAVSISPKHFLWTQFLLAGCQRVTLPGTLRSLSGGSCPGQEWSTFWSHIQLYLTLAVRLWEGIPLSGLSVLMCKLGSFL